MLRDEDYPTMSASRPMRGVIGWIDYRLPIFSFLRRELYDYPAPSNLTYLWNFGSIAGIVLVIMIVTGVVLAMHYTPTVDGAFNSVEHIMRDVNYGWLIRYVHTTGASMLFAAVYIHVFRGLYYGSYKAPRELLWWLGVIILLLMMATAFFGYTLPWGQMSFWGATVIANLFSAVPIVGDSIVAWLWGGYSVGGPTLNRFYAVHFVLPFVILAVVGLHLVALHRFGSNNPLGIESEGPQDTIPFHPHFTVKDRMPHHNTFNPQKYFDGGRYDPQTDHVGRRRRFGSTWRRTSESVSPNITRSGTMMMMTMTYGGRDALVPALPSPRSLCSKVLSPANRKGSRSRRSSRSLAAIFSFRSTHRWTRGSRSGGGLFNR